MKKGSLSLMVLLWLSCSEPHGFKVVKVGFNEFRIELVCSQTLLKHPLRELAIEMYLPWKETFPAAEQSCLQLSDSSQNYSILLFYGTYYDSFCSVLDSLTQLTIQSTQSISDGKMLGNGKIVSIEKEGVHSLITYWAPNLEDSQKTGLCIVFALYVVDDHHFLKLSINNKVLPKSKIEDFILESKQVANSLRWERQT